MHVTIISEDIVHARILEENLKRHGFAVSCVPFSRLHVGDGEETPVFKQDGVLLLDLGWFESFEQTAYQTLVWLLSSTCLPSVVLADSSWPEAWLRQFQGAAVLRRPFAMEAVNKAVQAAARRAVPDCA